jgi:steroid 5-alpha reductase family enzyme
MSFSQATILLTTPRVLGLPPVLLVFLGLALLVSSIGFRRVVYFISVGYAFSIVAMALCTLILFFLRWFPLMLLQQAVLLAWGLRLGIYLVRRELHPAYAAQIAATHERTAGMELGKKILIWAGVSVLYVSMYSPALFYAAADPRATGTLVWGTIGVVIGGGGLLLEAVADAQKAAFKRRSPRDFCNTGLYRVVRCPNYLGEILVWVGTYVCAIGAFSGVASFLLSSFGLICIVLIMMGSAKRLEREQEQRYGSREDYQSFTRTVPILFPWVPLYSLEKVRVFLE